MPDLVEFVENELKSVSIKKLFGHYNDVIVTLADRLNKNINPVKWINFDLKVRKDRFEHLSSCFIHAIRNSIDHGIEPSEDRSMMGKPPGATLSFEAEQFENQNQLWLRIIFSDDGQGIHAENIRKKLQLIHPDVDLTESSDFDIIQHVFDSGLSTRDAVGDFSGRGIGMNAIKDEAEKLGGHAFVESTPPNGTRLVIEVPFKAVAAASQKAA